MQITSQIFMGKKIVEKPLKDLIIEILGKDGRSINDLSKELEKRGIKKHRLILTGYLQAMADLGILKERYIKPAKVYSVQQNSRRTIYEIVGNKVKEINEEEAPDIALYILYKLFNRPIFMREIEKCNVGIPQYREKIVGAERKRALEILLSQGFHVPRNNSAYLPTKDFNSEFIQVLSELVIDGYDLKHLVNREKKQTKLDYD
ncbi:hypothetical protein [Aciduliprofundum sp. MAR08-339]|uniref:hypothetical protein n=1 Tax=Aciduliprofundum sp. (strain MAR08-339) TaxID=673860 RepID=UPI00307FFE24